MIDQVDQSDYFWWSIMKSDPIPNTISSRATNNS